MLEKALMHRAAKARVSACGDEDASVVQQAEPNLGRRLGEPFAE